MKTIETKWVIKLNINHIVRINYINFDSINIMNNFKEETKIDNTSCLGMHAHEVYNDTGSLPIHMLPTCVRYKIITDINHTCNHERVSLKKASILKQLTT